MVRGARFTAVMFDVEALSRDLMRALPGPSSQPAFSRALDFRSNAAYLRLRCGRLRVLDSRSASLQLSAQLELPGSGYGWGLAQTQSGGSVLQLRGGPAAGGVLTVDLASGPPRVLGYEY